MDKNQMRTRPSVWKRVLRQKNAVKERKNGRRFPALWTGSSAFVMATVMMLGIAAFGVGFTITTKDYPTLRESFVMTMDETRRFTFVPRGSI